MRPPIDPVVTAMAITPYSYIYQENLNTELLGPIPVFVNSSLRLRAPEPIVCLDLFFTLNLPPVRGSEDWMQPECRLYAMA